MLNNTNKNSPFRVPDNYFQHFNSDILSKLPEKEKSNKTIPLWRSVTKWSAVAAIIIGFIVVGLNQLEENNNTRSNNTSTEVLPNNERLASIENDYYLFLEDETTELMYKDSFYSDQL